MTKLKQILYYFGGIAIVSILIVLSISSTVRSVSVSPLRQTVVVDPGKSDKVEIFIVNDSDIEKTYTTEVDSFTIEEKTGRAIFGSDDIAEDWVVGENDSITLKPGENRSVAYNISVPANSEPGSHYLGLFLKEIDAEGQIGLGTRIGSIFYLHVAGEIIEEMTRQEFKSLKKIYFGGNIKLIADFENTGSIHVIPKGKISLLNRKGEVIESELLNTDEKKVIPHTRWPNEFEFDGLNIWDAGPVKAHINVKYGLNEQQIIENISFWYIPKMIIYLGVFLLILIISLVALNEILPIIRKKQQKKNK